jgi:hypothetical protein
MILRWINREVIVSKDWVEWETEHGKDGGYKPNYETQRILQIRIGNKWEDVPEVEE